MENRNAARAESELRLVVHIKLFTDLVSWRERRVVSSIPVIIEAFFECWSGLSLCTACAFEQRVEDG